MGIVKNNIYRFSSESLLDFFTKESIFGYYHIVRNDKVPHIENLYSYKNKEQFISDVDFLSKHYQAVTPDDIAGGKIPENSFLLSFDDGLEEIYSVVFPILKEKNIKAVFFINPDFVDNEKSLYKHDISVAINYLKKIDFEAATVKKIAELLSIGYSSNADFVNKFKNTKFADRNKINDVLKELGIDMKDYLQTQKPYVSKVQIKEMIDAGFYFGGHTMSHPPLGQLSFEEQKSEIINSIEWLKTNFGITYSLFAFPFTDKNISQKMIDALIAYDKDILIFGNSGLKKDVSNRIVQRFSLENPDKKIEKLIVSENLYKLYNKLSGKYNIRRK